MKKRIEDNIQRMSCVSELQKQSQLCTAKCDFVFDESADLYFCNRHQAMHICRPNICLVYNGEQHECMFTHQICAHPTSSSIVSAPPKIVTRRNTATFDLLEALERFLPPGNTIPASAQSYIQRLFVAYLRTVAKRKSASSQPVKTTGVHPTTGNIFIIALLQSLSAPPIVLTRKLVDGTIYKHRFVLEGLSASLVQTMHENATRCVKTEATATKRTITTATRDIRTTLQSNPRAFVEALPSDDATPA